MNPAISCPNPGSQQNPVRTPRNPRRTPQKTVLVQIVIFNYDGNPKAVNQLCAQIKAKKPATKTMIMAKAISPEKAVAHSKTASGATGYYQYPLDAAKIEKEFKKIESLVKKVS